MLQPTFLDRIVVEPLDAGRSASRHAG